jgi:hypothetical protein
MPARFSSTATIVHPYLKLMPMYLFTPIFRLLACSVCAAIILVTAGSQSASAQAITENFDTVATLGTKGWAQQNLSSPIGPNGYYQPLNSANLPFAAYNGVDTAYIAANYASTTTSSTGTISNWLFVPSRTFRNGDTIAFYTRTTTPGTTAYPDRVELRLSTNGTSVNAGTSSTSVGDFTTLLLSVNPGLTATGYPTTWTEYRAVISGLSAPTAGRVAFRYYVTNGGGTGSNSDFIGIDNFRYLQLAVNCPTIALSPGTLPNGQQNTSYNQAITASGGATPYTFTVSSGSLPTGVTLSSGGILSGTPTSTGVANITVRATDINGCSGTANYALNVAASCGTATALSYSGAPFCPTGTATPTLTGSSGGSYSSSAGIVINGTTGAINLATSTPGVYTITYSIPAAGSCPAASTTTSININSTPATPTITQNGANLQSSSASGNQWYFGGNAIASATGQSYAPTQSGNYTVQVTSNGCPSAMSASFAFTATAVSSLSVENGFQVGPNPARSIVRLKYAGSGGRFSVRLLSTEGRQVLPTVRFSNSQSLDLHRLAAGTYIIELYDERSGKRSQQMIQKL